MAWILLCTLFSLNPFPFLLRRPPLSPSVPPPHTCREGAQHGSLHTPPVRSSTRSSWTAVADGESPSVDGSRRRSPMRSGRIARLAKGFFSPPPPQWEGVRVAGESRINRERRYRVLIRASDKRLSFSSRRHRQRLLRERGVPAAARVLQIVVLFSYVVFVSFVLY